MLELNPDYVGWLTVYGTEVDGPVVQGEDNDEYLRTDFYGDYSIGGVFFMDCLVDLEQDGNLMIYGHMMYDETMFGPLRKYRDAAFFKENNVLRWEDRNGEHFYKFVAGLILPDTADDTEYIDFRQWLNEQDAETTQRMLEIVEENAYIFQPDIMRDGSEKYDILRKYHPKEGTTVCSRLPGRTRNAIKARLATLGIVAPNNRWTKEEDNILQEYYPIEGLAACSRLPGRTRAATQQRAVNLGLTMSSRWTEEEDNILREQYPIEGMAVCSRLPGRSRNSVMQRVFRLNLTVSSRWTKEEDDILRTHYPKEGVAVCSRIPGRTKEATMSRVSHLGIASRRRRWTKGEDDILRKYYPIEGTAVYSRLPGRTRHGIQKRVVALSLHAEEAQATNRLPSGGKRSG